MARIRSIKPEFPQSESMGRVSRDARLLFIQLWTIADDSGRLRGNSRMLASLLFPYDDDAPALIGDWLAELDAEGCVRSYRVDNDTYIQICNWLNHQKIDKPSPSKIPEFSESSRIVANVRERSSEDQGSRIKEGIKENIALSAPLNEPPTPAGSIGKPATGKPAAPRKTAALAKSEPPKSGLAWNAYAAAYRDRYHVEPVRNSKANALLCQLVDAVGAEEAPQVAAFYVSHNKAWYVDHGHDLAALVKDAGWLRTQWLTGRTVTSGQARQADRTQGQANVWNEIIAEERGKERAINER